MVTSATPLARSARTHAGALAVAAAALAIVGCTPERGETDSEATVASTLAVPQVTAPPERQTPFCQIMLELDASLPEDQTVDVTDMALDAYREALPVAPSEIADELEAVIVGLETGSDPTVSADGVDEAVADDINVGEAPDAAVDGESTTSDTFVPPTTTPSSVLEPPTEEEAFTAEGYLPDDDPTLRLNEYVDFACRDNLNNPGPPATQPSATPAPSIDE